MVATKKKVLNYENMNINNNSWIVPVCQFLSGFFSIQDLEKITKVPVLISLSISRINFKKVSTF